MQNTTICKTLSEEVKSSGNDALFSCSHCESISLGCTGIAQKSFLSVQPEEPTCRAPKSFLHTIPQYYHKRRDSQNE
jgi:hypothetical protein